MGARGGHGARTLRPRQGQGYTHATPFIGNTGEADLDEARTGKWLRSGCEECRAVSSGEGLQIPRRVTLFAMTSQYSSRHSEARLRCRVSSSGCGRDWMEGRLARRCLGRPLSWSTRSRLQGAKLLLGSAGVPAVCVRAPWMVRELGFGGSPDCQSEAGSIK